MIKDGMVIVKQIAFCPLAIDRDEITLSIGTHDSFFMAAVEMTPDEADELALLLTDMAKTARTMPPAPSDDNEPPKTEVS